MHLKQEFWKHLIVAQEVKGGGGGGELPKAYLPSIINTVANGIQESADKQAICPDLHSSMWYLKYCHLCLSVQKLHFLYCFAVYNALSST